MRAEGLSNEVRGLDDWRVLRFAEVAGYSLGRTPPRKSSDYWSKADGIPWVTISDMTPFGVVRTTAETVSSKAAHEIFQSPPVPQGTLLMSFKLTIGRTAILGIDAYHNEAIISIVPKSVVDRDFLRFYLPTIDFTQHQDRAVKGQTLNRGKIDSLPVVLPPLAEQRAIAGVLARIQAAVEVREKVVAALKELKAATMAKLFREGLRGEPHKQTEIGEIPESWEVVRLGDYCEKPCYGYTESASSEPVGPKFLRITDITEHGVNWDAVPYCSCPPEVLDEFWLKPGDLVVARIGATTGKSYLITECPEAVFASYLIRLRARPGLDPAYLSCFLEADAYWGQVRASKSSNLKGGMNASILSKLLIPLSSAGEQKQIAATLKQIDWQIATVVKRLNAFKSLFSSMLYLLMTGRVRVTRKMIALEALEDRRKRRPKWSGKIDEKVLQEVVRRIVEAVAPEKIILFGSAARGEMGPDSDVDLLVVKACDSPHEVERQIYRRLIGIGVAKDVLVVTPQHLDKHKDTIGYIYRPALREGKLIYAR